ncbi:class I adenylate-forming enzyme family protein [Oricola indica]|uniref:class I adenylate-forming enzyme family protein n=1 Tax=Oricola indica TaxID=2872591 RepID=UPI003CCB7F17
MTSMANSIRHHARLRPDAVALIEGDREISYSELDALVSGCAAQLTASGVQAGDRVAVILPNSVAWVVAYQGAMRIGAIPVPLNPLLADAEITTILADCEPAAVVSRGAHVYFGGQTPPCPVFDIEADDGGIVSTTGPVVECAPCAPTDTAVILYSSGSTGRPKGVELSHHNLFWNSQAFALDLLRLTPEDRGYGVLPMSHVFGHTCLFTTFLMTGASIVLSPRFDPVETFEAMSRHRITIFMGVPTMYWTLGKAELPEGIDLSSWRACVSGGQALPEEVHVRFEERFGVPISEGYGMTEASPSVCGVRIFDEERRAGSSGRPYWGVRVDIVDEAGNELPVGERGEIAVTSPGLAKGYYRRPDLTAEAFRDGRLHTGDVGLLDEDGFLYVVDRKKEMIISGGYNVYPREIEEMAHRMEGVLEVAAIGEPDERLGERIIAYVVPENGKLVDPEAMIAEWGANLARYKVPRAVRVLDALPRNATGKVDRMRLRDMNLDYG